PHNTTHPPPSPLSLHDALPIYSDHPQESVLEPSAALQVGPPVAGVHVADADENCRTNKGSPLLPEASLMVRDFDGAVDPLQRHVAALWDLRSHSFHSCHLASVYYQS